MYGVVSGSVIRMGMWSDDISWTVCQEIRMARDGEARVMSGDVGCVAVLYGLRVGMWLLFRMEREYSCWMSDVPLGSGDCVVSQEGSWALKSPMTIALGRVLRKSSWSWKLGGVEEAGGM